MNRLLHLRPRHLPFSLRPPSSSSSCSLPPFFLRPSSTSSSSSSSSSFFLRPSSSSFSSPFASATRRSWLSAPALLLVPLRPFVKSAACRSHANQGQNPSPGAPAPGASVAKKKDDDEDNQSEKVTSFAPPARREDILTIPNMLSLSRLVLAPFIGYLVLQGSYDYALAGFAVAGITDFMDGYIARAFDQRTIFGTVLDPMADKLLMSTMTITLAYTGLLPVPLAGLIFARDFGLIMSGFYFRWASLPPPKTLGRYFDFKLPSAEVKPSLISKVNTALQLVLMGATMASPVLGLVGHPLLEVLWYTVAGTTISSGLSYIVWAKDAIVFVKPKH